MIEENQEQSVVDPQVNVEEEEQKAPVWRTLLYELIETLVIALVMVLAINTLSARIRVDGYSMEPSLHNNNYVIVSKVSYAPFGEIERGDVIVFRFPRDPDQDYIKRVIGLPGDQVEILSGKVYVNDVLLDEPYIMETTRREDSTVVPAGHVYVMGDNRNDSSDSRIWGGVEIENIVGKAVFTYWPFSDFGLVEHYEHLAGDH